MTKKTIIRNFLWIIIGSLFQMPSLFAQEQSMPWKTIFNGKDLDGWEMIGDRGVAAVQDDEIIIHRTKETKEHTFLATKKKYGDFILEIDFKMDDPGWSTGVLVRCIGAKADSCKVRLYGYQIKIDDTPRNWTGGIFDDYGGTWKWICDLSKNEPARQALKKGGWNTFKIQAVGKNVKVWLNGVPSANITHDKYKKGSIALKIHSMGTKGNTNDGLLVHFKNIRIINNPDKKYLQ
jgi:hypothetical protein